jgi:SsrA-binding protein
MVPLRVYFTHGVARVELALAKGKRQHEKRQAIARRDAMREAERELGRRR